MQQIEKDARRIEIGKGNYRGAWLRLALVGREECAGGRRTRTVDVLEDTVTDSRLSNPHFGSAFEGLLVVVE